MNNKKKEAIELRKSGLSYSKISSNLGVPKGTLSGWFRNETWSKEVRKTLSQNSNQYQMGLINKARKQSLEQKENRVIDEALTMFNERQLDPLFIAGLCLYWGEGDKRTRHQVRITNTDPGIIRLFLRFLNVYSNILQERVWIALIIYKDLDIETCETFWQKETGLTASHFQKTITIAGKGTERRSPHGICILGISSTELKTKISTWIAELAKRL